MDELGLTAAILPELHALHGVEQNRYHHADVHAHTIEVLEQAIALQADPGAVFGAEHAGAIARAARRAARRRGRPRPRAAPRRAAARRRQAGDARAAATTARRRSSATTAPAPSSARDDPHAPAREREAQGARRRADAPPPAARLPRPRDAAVATRAVPLPDDVRAGRGRRHAAVGRRPAGDARAQGAGVDRQAPRARARGPARGAARGAPQGRRTPLVRGDVLAAALGDRGRAASSAACWPRSTRRASPARSTTRDQALALATRLRERAASRADHLGFAPRWPHDPDCLFCKIVAGEIPATIVAEDERTIAFMDINPATRGHALVIPRAHARDVHEIDPEDLEAVAATAQQLAAQAIERLGADGVNLLNSNGAGGLADGLPLPHARHPALRGRPAEAALGARRRATSTRSPRPARSSRSSRPRGRALARFDSGRRVRHIARHGGCPERTQRRARLLAAAGLGAVGGAVAVAGRAGRAVEAGRDHRPGRRRQRPARHHAGRAAARLGRSPAGRRHVRREAHAEDAARRLRPAGSACVRIWTAPTPTRRRCEPIASSA